MITKHTMNKRWWEKKDEINKQKRLRRKKLTKFDEKVKWTKQDKKRDKIIQRSRETMKKISNKQTKEDKQQQQLNKPKKTKWGENKQTNKNKQRFQLLKWKVLKQIKNKTNMARIVKKTANRCDMSASLFLRI